MANCGSPAIVASSSSFSFSGQFIDSKYRKKPPPKKALLDDPKSR